MQKTYKYVLDKLNELKESVPGNVGNKYYMALLHLKYPHASWHSGDAKKVLQALLDVIILSNHKFSPYSTLSNSLELEDRLFLALLLIIEHVPIGGIEVLINCLTENNIEVLTDKLINVIINN